MTLLPCQHVRTFAGPQHESFAAGTFKSRASEGIKLMSQRPARLTCLRTAAPRGTRIGRNGVHGRSNDRGTENFADANITQENVDGSTGAQSVIGFGQQAR